MDRDVWEVADDERTVTFEIRDDVELVDGTHLDAAGARDVLRRALRLGGLHLEGHDRQVRHDRDGDR